MTSDDLERMRAAVAGMHPAPWFVHPKHGDLCYGDPNDDRENFPLDNPEDDEGTCVLRNAEAIRQERHWWCEPLGEMGWVVFHEITRTGFKKAREWLCREDDTPFTGPDSCTPLIEADNYFKERGR